MVGAFLITIREGLEAALIIGIILAYLARTGNRQGFKQVWIGTSLGGLVSLAAGAVVYLAAGELKSPGEEIFEGSAMLLAAGMLTWMIFWMRKQAINIKAHLQAQIQSALSKGSSFALIAIVFLAVVREGIETVLFLFAATRTTEAPLASTAGGLLGLASAAAIGYLIYKGASGFNIKVFFNVTSVILVFFAAGLLAHGIHELNEVGIIPSIIEHVWDINSVIPEKGTFGRFLTALLGYNGNPSLSEVFGYAGYLVTALGGYFYRPKATLQSTLGQANG